MERNISKADRKKAKKDTMGGLDESQHSVKADVKVNPDIIEKKP